MEKDSQDRASASEKSMATPKTGRFLAGLSFLLSLTALLGGGYLYYLFVYLNPMLAIDQRIEGLESAGLSVTTRLKQIQAEQPSALEAFQSDQARRLAEVESSLIDALNSVSSQAPPSPRVWKLAEAEYLLRIANHRLLMERDVPAALQLLKGADQILLEIDDFGFFEVRARLADEMLALGAVRDNDLQGI